MIRYKGSELPHLYGWIAPDGTMYECAYMDHMAAAEAIVNQLFGNHESNPEKILEDHNYLRVVKSSLNNRDIEIIAGNMMMHLTEAQKQKIKELNYDLEEIVYL